MDFCSNFICGNVRFPKRLRLCFSGFRLDRPDEFVYALTAGAPENSAIFSGTVLDENGNPMENVSINIQWQQNNTWLSKQIPVDENGFFEQENLTPALLE